jgi:hypothetical protein
LLYSSEFSAGSGPGIVSLLEYLRMTFPPASTI